LESSISEKFQVWIMYTNGKFLHKS
jgi:hypothetical protein